MNYKATLNDGEEIHLQNSGDQTTIAVTGGHQNQSSSFTTGKWTKKPEVWSVRDDFVAQINTEDGEKYLAIHEHGIKSLDEKPELAGAQPLDLEESEDQEPAMEPIKPMAPMEPMTPMKPL